MHYTVCIIENERRALNAIADVISMSADLRCPEDCRFVDAASALELIPQRNPAAVVVDLELGTRGLSGIECIRGLREALPSVHIVVYSRHDEPEWIFPALRAGANGYILKQTPAALIEGLTALCCHQVCPPISSQVARKILSHFRNKSGVCLTELTPSEEQVLQLLAAGCLNKEVSSQMKLSPRKIDELIASSKRKLHARSREEAVAKYAVATQTPGIGS